MAEQNEVEQLVQTLESHLDGKPCWIKIALDGEGGAIYGTRAAYAKCGLQLVRSALVSSSPPAGEQLLEVEWPDLLTDDSDRLDFSLYVQQMPPESVTSESNGSGSGYVGWILGTMVVAIVSLAAIGFVAVIRFFS